MVAGNVNIQNYWYDNLLKGRYSPILRIDSKPLSKVFRYSLLNFNGMQLWLRRTDAGNNKPGSEIVVKGTGDICQICFQQNSRQYKSWWSIETADSFFLLLIASCYRVNLLDGTTLWKKCCWISELMLHAHSSFNFMAQKNILCRGKWSILVIFHWRWWYRSLKQGEVILSRQKSK